MKLENEITVEVLETKENVIKSISNNGFKLEKEYDINDIYLVKKGFENCKNYNELLNNSILIRDISEKPNTRKLITYKLKHIDDNGNILSQINANVEINNIEDAYNMLKLIGYIDLMKISDHISVYQKNNGDELALQFVNDKIYIEIEEKCEHTGKLYESLDYMKSIIDSLNLSIKNNNYYAKKAEDILNDKKDKGEKIMELWEVLDDNGNPTGEIMEKYDQRVFDKGLYHLGTDVWIINSENKILIQKRSNLKKLEPNAWAMTGGSVILGEKSKETIVREAKEELDIDINPNELKFMTKFKTGNVWIDTYILKHDYDISKMKFQEDEVADAKWATWEEINTLVKNGKFIKHRWEFVNQFLKYELEETK